MIKYFGLLTVLFLGFILIACQPSEQESLEQGSLSEFNLEDISFNVVEDDLKMGSTFITLNITNNSYHVLGPRGITRIEYWAEADGDWITLFDINDRSYILDEARVVIEPLENSVFQEQIPYQIEDSGRYRVIFEISVYILVDEEETSEEVWEFSGEVIEFLGEFNVQ